MTLICITLYVHAMPFSGRRPINWNACKTETTGFIYEVHTTTVTVMKRWNGTSPDARRLLEGAVRWRREGRHCSTLRCFNGMQTCWDSGNNKLICLNLDKTRRLAKSETNLLTIKWFNRSYLRHAFARETVPLRDNRAALAAESFGTRSSPASVLHPRDSYKCWYPLYLEGNEYTPISNV